MTVPAPSAFLHRIATAVPGEQVHGAFVEFAQAMLADDRTRSLFLRMAAKANIDNRFSVLRLTGPSDADGLNAYEFYRRGGFASTGERMAAYERFAPGLLREALDRLRLTERERRRIRHVLVTSCTGLYAPGLDFVAIEHLGLDTSTERTMIGFMGCYAAINALKQARHIVRSHPEESVLVINLELCTLHFQETQDLNQVLSFLIFGDGCAAALVSAEPEAGALSLDSFRAVHLPDTRDLITWRIGDAGFDMVLSGKVPAAIGRALGGQASELREKEAVELWAVHPGGRSVLDAVEEGLELPREALCVSREVLRRYGNLSSATVMFVMAETMRWARPGQRGCAMSFGPGLTAETMRFHAI